ncbi:TetR/AcrR family transcriptional regulator [Pseudomaricurvus sp. HS19]|uniref:TetR/AcrR family transcriptional regulator n=1 Tax=Pseudomaricurvus sp. HS19 TaxID=2692626 RepID=UPI00136F76CA|nr:TetR/AcrR family transcriptional regulator [Pseudomaricurvus sp. HS19]MYM64443.1 TetR family transcriptional regulator [Pseudomaricurvus sp. HS19]
MAAQPRRELLLDTAQRLFSAEGYHATGIDRILAESGVSKATLYKHFASKEELVLAVLRRRHDQFLQAMERHLQAAEGEPVLQVFDLLHQWFHSGDFHGCNFINASAEYAQESPAILACTRQHKASVRQLLEQWLPTVPEVSRAGLAERLALLMDGAIVSAQAGGNADAALTARDMARSLLSHYRR